MPELRIELNSYRIGDLLEQKGLHYPKWATPTPQF